MTTEWKGSLKVAVTAAMAVAMAAPAQAQAPVPPAGFSSIFDGKSLTGWKGDPAFFSVRNGVLVGGSDRPVEKNTYLILEKPYADFELHYKFRWASEGGNSGIQFRSGQTVGNHVLAGMQANVTPVNPARAERYAMLYEELGDRQEMVLLGQKAEITRVQAVNGGQGRIVRKVTGTTNPREAILASIKPYPAWNEGVLIAHGSRIVHVVNGLVAFDATDLDPLTQKSGLIGIQVHFGPAMAVEFKDMFIRTLESLPDLSRFKTSPTPAPEPTTTYKDSTKVNLPDTPLP